MELSITEIVSALRPNEPFYIVNNVLEGVHFINNDVPALTAAEVAEVKPKIEFDKAVKIVERQRQDAYQAEADPLFFKSQRGKASKDEWLAKVAEIDERFPYPEKPKGKK